MIIYLIKKHSVFADIEPSEIIGVFSTLELLHQYVKDNYEDLGKPDFHKLTDSTQFYESEDYVYNIEEFTVDKPF